MRELILLPLSLLLLLIAQSRTVEGMPRYLSWSWLVVGGACLVSVASRRPRERVPRWAAMLLCAGLVAVAIQVHRPVRDATFVAAAMVLLASHSSLATGPAALALGVVAGLTGDWLFPYLSSYWDIAPTVAVLGRLGGMATGTDIESVGPLVSIGSDSASTLLVAMNWENVGLREALALVIAGTIAVFALHRGRCMARHIGCVLFWVGAGWLIRATIYVVSLVEGLDPEAWISPWLRFAALGLPVAVGFALSDRPCEVSCQSVAAPRSAGQEVAPVIRWSCVWGVLLAIWQASGPVKIVDGVVAIDEAHSEWERLDMPLDRRHFGTRSEYNYADFVRGLEARNGPVRRLHGPATEGALDGVAVLILKTPTVPFSSDECATIERFVRAGGGLFLIGDHTDVFGMNTVLADVATPFGMRFEPVALFESDIVGGEVLAPGRLPPHPIVSSMRPMHWMTSCALRLDLPARPIVWSSLSYADKADYGRYTFFGDHILATDEAWGSFCQAAVAEVGAGRVLAFTDSTLLSNFSIFCPGVREIAFGGVEWLRQRESWGSWRLLALALVVGMAVPWRLPRRWEMLAALTLGAASGLCVSRVSVTRAMQGFERELAGRETVFDTTCSAGQLPLWHESHEFRDEFWELFSCFQRSGGLMRVAMPGEDPLTGSTAIFIWPKNPMVDSLASRVEAFVKGGGRLYVFDDRIAGGSGANDLVMPFGLRFERMVGGCRVPAKEVPGAKSFVDIQNAAQVTGGCAVVRDENGNTLVARVAYGSGSVVACGVAADLSSMFMGSAGVLHGAEGEDLVQLSYEIIDAGLRNDRRPAGTR